MGGREKILKCAWHVMSTNSDTVLADVSAQDRKKKNPMLNKHYVANFRLSELFYHDILYWIKLGSYILSCTLQNFSFNQDVYHTR